MEEYADSLHNTLIDYSPVALAIFDTNMRYLAVSHRWMKEYGLVGRNIIGLSHYEVFPEIPASWRLIHQQALQGVKKLEGEDAFVRKSGTVQWIRWMIQPWQKSNGDVGGIVIFSEDITARKEDEDALRKNETYLRALFQSISDYVFVLDIELPGPPVIVDGNDAAFAKFGYAREEMIGQPITRFETDTSAKFFAHRSTLIKLNGIAHFEVEHLCKDGSTFIAQVSANPLSDGTKGSKVLVAEQDITEKRADEERIRNYIKQLEQTYISVVEIATNLVELRDPYTDGHEKRVGQIAMAIGTELGLDAHAIEGLQIGGYVHDIGKVAIPSEILTKPAKLSDVEYELVKAHAQMGYDILKKVDFPWPIAEIAHQHHERMDGSGYPQGLKGDEILFEARIIAVADVVEAMASHRPYRPGIALEHALDEIEKGKGIKYDANIADACLRLFREKGYELPNRDLGLLGRT